MGPLQHPDAAVLQLANIRLFDREKARQAGSKYDFVKVKVWLGEDLNHYYVLSRFLISRTLTVTKIPHMKAVKIALEVKKHLVDNEHLDISQAHFEEILFHVMRSKGFGEEYILRYKMVSKFHHQRRPLVILICGSACTGKSTLAQQLAARLNLPNVLQTDVIYELLRMSEDAPLSRRPLWERGELAPRQLVTEFQRECHVVRKGIDGDLVKCIRDGKSFIIEGLHLDPGLYLYEFGRHGMVHLHNRPLVREGAGPDLPPAPSPAEHRSPAQEPSSPPQSPPERPAQHLGEGAEAGGKGGEGLGSPLVDRGTQSDGAFSGGIARVRAEAQCFHDAMDAQAGGHRRCESEGTSPVAPSAFPRRTFRSASTGRVMFALQQCGSRKMQPTLASLSEPLPIIPSHTSDGPQAAAPSDERREEDQTLGISPASAWLAGLEQRSSPAASQQPTSASQSKAAAGTSGGLLSLPAAGGQHNTPSKSAPTAVACSLTVSPLDASLAAPVPLQASSDAAACLVPSAAAAAAAVAEQDAAVPANGRDLDRPPRSVQFDVEADAAGMDSAAEEQGPVFVPIVLRMAPADHAGVIEDRYLRQQVASNGSAGSLEAETRGVAERLQTLQEHLCSYAARSVPVVDIEFTTFGDTLDRLHDYLLQCMDLALKPSGV